MKILFLDQNKWIDIARVANNHPSAPLQHIKLYDSLARAVDSGKLVIPLTMSHIIETSKKNDTSQRQRLAKIQSKLSKGLVFRSRQYRLALEIQKSLRKVFREPEVKLADSWFIGGTFMQAFNELDDDIARNPSGIDSSELLYDFLVSQDDGNRRKGNSVFSQSSDELVKSIEARRGNWKSENRNLQGRAYAVIQFYEHQDVIISQLQSIGHTVDEFKQLGDTTIRLFFEDIPTLKTERELAIKIESQARKIHPNDLRDLYSFCAAIPLLIG